MAGNWRQPGAPSRSRQNILACITTARSLLDFNPLAACPGRTTINFDGFYVYATWYLTGESRAEQYRGYEEFNAPGNGNVAQIKILNPWSAGGWGAWELAARVSEINLNRGGFLFLQPLGTPSNIQGGRQSGLYRRPQLVS